MKMSQAHLGIAAAIVAMFAGLGAPAAADGRRSDVDFYGLLDYTSSDGGQLRSNPRVRFNLDHAWMLGFGSAYHFRDQLGVLTELEYGHSNLRFTDTQAANVPSIIQKVDYFNGRPNLEFTSLPEPSSHVTSAGIGFNKFRTVVPGVNPQVYCQPGFFATYWWCETGVRSFDETGFSYNVGIGERMDISRSAECEHRMPAGELGYWIDGNIVSLSTQPAERFEIPPDELRAFVRECDDTAESGGDFAITQWPMTP
jgi:hypothetical protein